MPTKPRAAISWSGGKDSCLAWIRARETGLAVTTFVTMCDVDGASKSHALAPELIAAQVGAMGGEWRPVRTGSAEYAGTFDHELQSLRRNGHTHMVFGDIDLAAHREWLEPACVRADLVAVFPLWGQSRAALAQEVIAREIRARVVCVDTRWLDQTYCGVDYDRAFISRLPAGVCPCGEEGEFHTFVYDAPGFARPLAIQNDAQRRVVSSPPWAPTEFVFQVLTLEHQSETAPKVD